MCWSFATTSAFTLSYALVIAYYRYKGRSWQALAFHVNQLCMEGSQVLNMLALWSGRHAAIGLSAGASMTVYYFIPFAIFLTLTASDTTPIMARIYPSSGPHKSALHETRYRRILALITAVTIADIWLGSLIGQEVDFLPALHKSLFSSWGSGFDLMMGPSHHVIWKYRPLAAADSFPYASGSAGLWCVTNYLSI